MKRYTICGPSNTVREHAKGDYVLYFNAVMEANELLCDLRFAREEIERLRDEIAALKSREPDRTANDVREWSAGDNETGE